MFFETLANLTRKLLSATVIAGGVMLPGTGCQTSMAKPPPQNFDSTTHPVCQRARELMSAEDWRIHVELPAVALLLSRSVQSNAVRTCSEELLNWLRPRLAARPIDLTPSLEPRVAALGALSEFAWNDASIQLLIRLLDVDETVALVHFEPRSVLPGPGSQEIALGPQPTVSVQTLRAWAATAISRAHTGRRIGPAYADLLARYFGRVPPESAAPLQREPALSILWPDLVRAYELSWKDARWTAVPTPWRQRLEALTLPLAVPRE